MDGEGNVYVTGYSYDSGTGSDYATIKYGSTNNPPVADVAGPYMCDESQCVTLDASGSSDHDEDSLIYEWDLDNDGFYDDATGVITSFSGIDDGNYTVAVRVTDDSGESDTDYATVTVTNVVVILSEIIVAVDPVLVKLEISASATFTDSGILDTHTAVWGCGDESTSVASVNEENGFGEVSRDPAYESAGIYTITLTLNDDDDGSDSAYFRYIVVYDPSEGFVTCGGWINSPAGAYAEDESFTGKETFGFVSKYKKGA